MKVTKFLLLISLFLTLVHPECKDPSQDDGACTSCQDVQVLVNGFCYDKIRGCLVHQVGPICIQCQNGYVLTEDTCVREAEFHNRNDLSQIPPVVPDNAPKLTRKEIIDEVARKYGDEISRVQNYLLDKYPEQLANVQIKAAETINSKRSTLVKISYSGGKKYQAVALLSYLNEVTDVLFGEVLQQEEEFRVESVQTILNTVFINTSGNGYLYDIKYDNGNLVFIQINGKDVNTAKIGKDQNIKSFESKSLLQFAFDKVLNQYPYLSKYELTHSQEKDEGSLFVFQLGSIISVSAQFDGKQFKVNSPIRVPGSIKPNVTTEDEPTLVGGFSQFTNFKDERFIRVTSFVEKQFRELQKAKIYRVQSQVVSGINFLIYYRTEDGTDYIVKVYHSLRGHLEILQAQNDRQNIFTKNHNYNSDDEFLNSYKDFKDQAKIIPIPPIVTVERKVETNLIKYRILYPDNVYAQFTFDRETNTTTPISYVVDGQNLLELRVVVGGKRERTVEELVQFVKSQHALKMQQVKDIKKEGNVFTLIMNTAGGTYEGKIEDASELSLVSWSPTDNFLACYDYDLFQFDKVKQLDNLLRQNFKLDGYDLKVLQVNPGTQPEYRLVYITPSLQQIVFYLNYDDSQVNVNKAFILNFGYGDLAKDDPLYIFAVEKGKELLPNAIALNGESNGTQVRLYLKEKEKTYQLIIRLEDKESQLKTIHVRKFFLVPNGFTISNLLSKEQIDGEEFQTLNGQIKDHFKVYLENAEVAYVDKKEENGVLIYNVFYFFEGKYYRTEAQNDNGMYIFGSLFITSYKPQDFGNCDKFDENQACLTCADHQFQYQGYCYNKIEGCLYQVGDLCIRCEPIYIRSENKCLKDCSAFFG